MISCLKSYRAALRKRWAKCNTRPTTFIVDDSRGILQKTQTARSQKRSTKSQHVGRFGVLFLLGLFRTENEKSWKSEITAVSFSVLRAIDIRYFGAQVKSQTELVKNTNEHQDIFAPGCDLNFDT
jgi:hypothetical protein